MTQIESLKAKIPSMDAKAKSRLRQNAFSSYPATPRMQVRAKFSSSSMPKRQHSPEETGTTSQACCLGKHIAAISLFFRAFHEDDVVGRIFMRANHSSTQKDVYTLEILGAPVEGAFHHIRDARHAGERVFAARKDGAQS